ncbi:MAG: hypothetical protein ACI9UA_002659 [Pseudoalteromonas tetraodonis]|jgi:hypothetical protein
MEQVKAQARLEWQIRQWAEALAWYLRWIEICSAQGGDPRTVPERMKAAVLSAGARRGHLNNTSISYASYVSRFGAWAGDAKAAQDIDKGTRLADLSRGSRGFELFDPESGFEFGVFSFAMSVNALQRRSFSMSGFARSGRAFQWS